MQLIYMIKQSDTSRKQVEQSSDNRCVLWRTACVLVFELSFKWRTFMFLMLFCSISAYFSEIQLVCDRRTDRPTDGRTDIPSYRDARTHLKRERKSLAFLEREGKIDGSKMVDYSPDLIFSRSVRLKFDEERFKKFVDWIRINWSIPAAHRKSEVLILL